MPIPAILAALAPLIGSAVAGYAGSKLAGTGTGSSAMPSSNQRGGVGRFFLGDEAQTMQFPKFNPAQEKAFAQILQQSLGEIGKNPIDFNPIEQKARMGFAQTTIPSIAERFTAMNGQRSSAFGQQLGAAGANLETDLGALRSQYGLQRQALLQNLLGLGLTPQFESAYSPRTQGFLETGAQGAASTLPLLAMLKYL